MLINVELVKWRIYYVIDNLQNDCQKMLNMLNVYTSLLISI